MRLYGTAGDILLLASLVCVVPVGAAADAVILVPSGWSPGAAAVDSAGGRLALPLTSTATGAERVMQHRDGSVRYTDVGGAIQRIDSSPDGTLLLVRHVPAGLPPVTELIDATGSSLWSKVDQRHYFFSSTGKAIHAWDPSDEHSYTGFVEVFGLNGVRLWSWQASGRDESAPPAENEPLHLEGVVSLGDGERIVVAIERMILCMDISQPQPTVEWILDQYFKAPDITWLSVLDNQRIIVRLDFGLFSALSLDGQPLAHFHPGSVGPEIPYHHPSEGSNASEVLAFDGTQHGFLVDLSNGDINEFEIPTDPSPGYERFGGSADFKLFFKNEDSIIVRSLG